MKITVCVKQVPDTWAEKRLRPEDSLLDRDLFQVVPQLTNEISKRAD